MVSMGEQTKADSTVGGDEDLAPPAVLGNPDWVPT